MTEKQKCKKEGLLCMNKWHRRMEITSSLERYYLKRSLYH